MSSEKIPPTEMVETEPQPPPEIEDFGPPPMDYDDFGPPPDIEDEPVDASQEPQEGDDQEPLPPPPPPLVMKKKDLPPPPPPTEQEIEDQKRREKLLVGFFNEKVRREAPSRYLNEIRVTLQWQSVLRKVKSQDARKYIKLLKQTFLAQLDHRGQMIRLIDGQIEDLRFLSTRAIGDHLMTLDDIMASQGKRLDIITTNFKKKKEAMKKVMNKDGLLNRSQNAEDIESMAVIRRAQRQEFEERQRGENAAYVSRKGEILEEGSLKRDQMQNTMEFNIINISNQLRREIDEFHESISDRMGDYTAIKEKDMYNSALLIKQKKSIAQMTKRIKFLRGKIDEHRDSNEELNGTLREEVKKVLEYTQKMKETIVGVNKRAKKNLSTLINETFHISTVLEEHMELGKSVLHMAECCTRLENESEQILPFYKVDYLASEAKIVEGCDDIVLPKDFPHELLSEYPLMSNFWKRFGKVAVDTLGIQKEIKDLKKENMQLRNYVSTFIPKGNIDAELKRKRLLLRCKKFPVCQPILSMPKDCIPEWIETDPPMNLDDIVDQILNF